ncbi:hypothetical protein MD588_06825 [Photobacterium sp. SDRW27]|uniref:hypothetical protein n=1 Tax=Photobacterium obscurum TaxID=2829490 RepID=UPI002244485E|nr:hypothetical protein [Photobacterium obscurum]MCW8328517.1 hypothetical protein [Photobacterium obscurum]
MRTWTVPTWTLVATGLLLNIISALMTNFFIDDATRQANDLIKMQQDNDKLINLIWQQVETVERKREQVLDLVSASEMAKRPIAKEVSEQVIADINYWLDNKIDNLALNSIPLLMSNLNKVQVEQRDKINQLYLDNLDLIEIHLAKMKSISQLRNLALFLQIIGLALVLARDLKKYEYRDEKN